MALAFKRGTLPVIGGFVTIGISAVLGYAASVDPEIIRSREAAVAGFTIVGVGFGLMIGGVVIVVHESLVQDIAEKNAKRFSKATKNEPKLRNVVSLKERSLSVATQKLEPAVSMP